MPCIVQSELPRIRKQTSSKAFSSISTKPAAETQPLKVEDELIRMIVRWGFAKPSANEWIAHEYDFCLDGKQCSASSPNHCKALLAGCSTILREKFNTSATLRHSPLVYENRPAALRRAPVADVSIIEIALPIPRMQLIFGQPPVSCQKAQRSIHDVIELSRVKLSQKDQHERNAAFLPLDR